MDARALALTAAAVAVLALPSAASATTAAVEDGVLRVTGERGELNQVIIRQLGGDQVEVADSDANTTPGSGCRRETTLVCSVGSAVVVSLRDADDALRVEGRLPVPVRYLGGTGRDAAYWPGRDGQGAIVSNDGRPNDGPDRWDDVEADVEILRGRPAADVLRSGSRGASVYPSEGNDKVRGGSGRDRIATTYIATDGTEAGFLYTEGSDDVRCGRGQDFVLYDRTDVVGRDCEGRGRPSGRGYYLFTGSRGDDFLGAPGGWSPARMYSGSGNDTVQAPSDGGTRVKLGAGNDRFRGGSTSSVDAQSGNDFIDVRNFNATDQVDCGSGRDRVLANPGDRIARNCERVTRYR